jgi:hypothetical protein
MQHVFFFLRGNSICVCVFADTYSFNIETLKVDSETLVVRSKFQKFTDLVSSTCAWMIWSVSTCVGMVVIHSYMCAKNRCFLFMHTKAGAATLDI